MQIVVDGVRIEYELTGSGPPVVLVHGLGGHKGTWRDQVAALRDSHRVLTYDQRCHGRSEAVPVSGLADFVADLRALLDRLDLGPAVVVGHSMGGVIALRLALEHPARVRGLVVASSASECNERTSVAWLRRAALAEELAAHGVPRPLPEDDGTGDVPLIVDALRNTSGACFAATARDLSRLWQHPLTPRLETLRCPALFVVGERDPIGVGGSVIMHRCVPGSKLAILPRAGHYAHRDAPVAFNAALFDFLGGLTSPES